VTKNQPGLTTVVSIIVNNNDNLFLELEH